MDAWMCDSDAKASETDLHFENNFVRAEKLPDTLEYLKKLDNKLNQVKGIKKETTSADILNAFTAKKNILPSSISYDYFIDKIDRKLLLERLFPNKQAVSLEELQNLVKFDFLQNLT